VVVTCEHASSASLFTRLQLMGGDAELGELSRYSLGNSGRMAPKDPGVEATPLGAALLRLVAPDIPVPMTPQGAPLAPGTSIANTTNTTSCQRMTGTSNVRLLSFNPTLPSTPGI
jgi:hypothetical protein